MGNRNLKDIAARMKGIDIAMLTTRTEGGQLASRPMSNNADVDYDGTSYYFTFDEARMVSDIEKDMKVSLGFSGKDGFYVAVQGAARLVRDKAAVKAHWQPELDQWFKQGIDTPGVVLIAVQAKRIRYWDGMDGGEVEL